MSGSIELVAVIGADGAVITWTPTAERLWGYPPDEVLGRPADRLLASGRKESRAGTPYASGSWSGPADLRRRDGGLRTVNFRVSPLPVAGLGEEWSVWEAGPVQAPPPSGLDPAVLRTLFEHSPMGVVAWDLDLRCFWHNDAATRMDVLPGGPHPGRRITEVLVPGRPEGTEAAMRQVLASGTPSLDLEWMLPAAAGKDQQFLSVFLFRLDDADGRPAGVCLIAVDVSDSSARQRFGLLIEAGTRIGTTLDVMRTAQELADTAVPGVADFVTVDLTDSVMPEEEPLKRLGSTEMSVPAFYRGGVASVRPRAPEALWGRGMPVFVSPSSPYSTVMATRQSYFEPVVDTSPGTWLDDDPDRARAMHDSGMHTMMVIPLHARGKLLGVAAFMRTRNPAPFNEADLILAEGLTARAALSLDNARRYSRERTAALALQRDLLPHFLSGGRAVEVASRYLPADTHGGVGGDWFDVIPMPHDRVALVVGDVAGHGIGAAATMGRLRMVLNTLTNLELPPDQVLDRLDELVVGLARDRPDEELASPSVGATCLYVVYDPATHRCTMASAGHPPPAIVRPDGTVAFAELPAGAPIGVGLRDFRSVEVHVPEGSLIVLYTDGLVETREADIDDGLDRLRAALALPSTGLDNLCAEVIDTMLENKQPDDDIALLIARTLDTRTPS